MTFSELQTQITAAFGPEKTQKLALKNILLLLIDYFNVEATLSGVQSTANLALIKSRKKGGKTTVIEKPSLQIDNDPLYCFSVYNNATTRARQIVNCVWLDGILNSKKDVSIDALKPGFFVNSKLAGIQTINLKSDTLAVKPLTINNLVVNSASITSTIAYMAIGDSITANIHTELDVPTPYWGYPSKALYNNLRDNIDSNSIPKMLMVGNMNVQSRTSTYKSQTITVKGGNAAMSGWAGCHYLYHAIRLTGIQVSSSGYVSPANSYYILGLKAQTTVDWTGSASQQELIRTTKFGKNPCDKTAGLYDWMKTQSDWTGANDAYTGTSTQNINMDTFLEYLCDNPSNPFYSKVKAMNDAEPNSFSLFSYLSRHKTLSDVIKTERLVVGSTAGTKVTDVNAYDVCTPTHITLNFGQNDNWLFPSASLDSHAITVRNIANTILSEYPNIQIGVLINPYPGTLYPELFPLGVRYAKNDFAINLKSGLRTALIANLGVSKSITHVGKITYIDAYVVMNPTSHAEDDYGENSGVRVDFEDTERSGVHPGLKAQAGIGDQVYGFLYHTTANPHN
jgi:hypothetical protein